MPMQEILLYIYYFKIKTFEKIIINCDLGCILICCVCVYIYIYIYRERERERERERCGTLKLLNDKYIHLNFCKFTTNKLSCRIDI